MKIRLWLAACLWPMALGAQEPAPKEQLKAWLEGRNLTLSDGADSACDRYAFDVIAAGLVSTVQRKGDKSAVVFHGQDGARVFGNREFLLLPSEEVPGLFVLFRSLKTFLNVEVRPTSAGIQFGAEANGETRMPLGDFLKAAWEDTEGKFTVRPLPNKEPGKLGFEIYVRSSVVTVEGVADAARPYPLTAVSVHREKGVIFILANIRVGDEDLGHDLTSVSTERLGNFDVVYQVQRPTRDANGDIDLEQEAKKTQAIIMSLPKQVMETKQRPAPANLSRAIFGDAWRAPIIPDHQPEWPAEALARADAAKRESLPRIVFPDGVDQVVVPAKRERSVLYLPVTINGQEVGHMTFDSGAGSSLLDLRVAKKLGLPGIEEGELKVTEGEDSSQHYSTTISSQSPSPGGVDGPLTTWSAELRSLRIGDLTVEKVANIEVADRSALPESDRVGFLGRDLVWTTPHTLDYQARTITFHRPETFQAPAEAIKLTWEPSPEAWATLSGKVGEDGTPAKFALDTGASPGVGFFQGFADAHPKLFESLPMIETVLGAITKPVAAKHLVWPELEALGQRFRDVDGALTPNFLGNDGMLDGLIGGEILRRFRVTLHHARGEAYLVPVSREAILQGLKEGRDVDWTLMEAAKDGDVELVKEALKAGGKPDKRAEGARMRPIEAACYPRDPACLRLLLETGKVTIEPRHSALDIAILKGRKDHVAMLLKAGVKVQDRHQGKPTPLAMAAQVGEIEVAKLLINAGAKVREQLVPKIGTPMAYAMSEKKHAFLQLLLDHGLKPNERQIGSGGQPIAFAAMLGDIESAKILLKAGADLNVSDERGVTPLIVAMLTKQEPMVKWLLEQGANPRVDERSALACLQTAVRQGLDWTLETLLAKGLAVKLTPAGQAPLAVLATNQDNPKIIDVLAKAGADLNEPARLTPLQYAAQNGKLEIVRALLKHGADKDRVNGATKRPCFLAAEAGHWEIVATLLESGAKGALNPKQDPEAPSDELKLPDNPLESVKADPPSELTLPAEDTDKAKEALDEFLPAPVKERSLWHWLAKDPKSGPFVERISRHLPVMEAETGDMPPIRLAAATRPDVLAAMLTRGAKANAGLLREAARAGQDFAVARLLKAGAPVNEEGLKPTALHEAVTHDDPELLRALLRRQAAVDAIDEDGRTPLMVAAVFKCAKSAKALLEAGADKSLKSTAGVTALDFAKKADAKAVVKLLE